MYICMQDYSLSFGLPFSCLLFYRWFRKWEQVKLFELLKLMLDMEVLAYGDIMVLTIESVVAPFDLGS